jgi:hypothetical protein
MKEPTSLIHALFAEAFQTERSAVRHPIVEAERLGDCPPDQRVALKPGSGIKKRAPV